LIESVYRMARRKRVALLVESSRAYGRGLLEGIAAYVRDQGNWSVYHQERGISDDAPAWFDRWQGDGVIARIENRSLIRALQRRGLPTVDLRGMHDIEGIPLIETDDRRVVELAFEHLRSRGCEHFAFCGLEGANFSQRRMRYFLPLVEAAGCMPHFYEGTVRRANEVTAQIEGASMVYESALERWIRSLPRPIGMMACNDARGQQVINACRELQVAIPDDVALISVDNDTLICELCDPPLSSVEPDTRRIGYTGAELLDAMMDGKSMVQQKIFVPPTGVVVRRSTEGLAIADREVANAVRFIREHACDGVGVDDVLAKVRMSRSTLERRFTRLVGRAPKQEIARVQIERVKQLLRNTDFTLQRIADLAGYTHVETLCVQFKQKVGVTPGAYRASSMNA
jgi:LacI family transcriptional regulator